MAATAGGPTPQVTRGCALLLACAPHHRATEFGITPALLDIIERIMELEDKSEL
jgi:hypothetical protein